MFAPSPTQWRALLRFIRSEVVCVLRRRGWHADVDDLVQTVALRVLVHDLAIYDEKRGALEGFVKNRVRWTVAEHVRNEGSRAARLSSVDSLEAEPVAPEPVEERPEEEVQALAAQALEAMNLRSRAYVRAALAGWPQTAIAEAEGVHPSRVTRWIQRGHEEARQALAAAA